MESNFKNDQIAPIQVTDSITPMKLDTGAGVNILSYEDFSSLKERPKLRHSNTKLKAYDGGDVPVRGQCILPISHKGRTLRTLFVISPSNVKPSLGRRTSENLGLIKRVFVVEKETTTSDEQQFFEKYSDCFKGLGCLPNVVNIELVADAVPVVEHCRKVPFALYDKFKGELERMENLGVIRKVEKPTEWVNSFVLVTKPNGKLRVCLDPRSLNDAIKREHFKLPTREEIAAKFADGKVFSKLDASTGFWQMRLNEKSSEMCTFNTPFGRYQYLRLPFGISSAPEIYYRVIHTLFAHLEGVDTSMDDIIVWGSNKEEHDNSGVLKNITVNL